MTEIAKLGDGFPLEEHREPEKDSLLNLGQAYAILVEAGMSDLEIAPIIGEMLISKSISPEKIWFVQ